MAARRCSAPAITASGSRGRWRCRLAPLRLETDAEGSLGAALNEWPVDHVAKVLAFYHPDDDSALKAEQEAVLKRAALACRQVGRELLVEIICSKNGKVGDDTMARVMRRLYEIGIKPDWWKLEGQPSAAAWAAIDAAIAENDPYCRGVVLLGLDAPLPDLERAFRLAQTAKTVKGFAVGRTIFGEAARGWLAGALDDEAATAMMAERFGRLVEAWRASNS